MNRPKPTPDAQLFAMITDQCGVRLHRLALRLTRNEDDAQDLVQETLLRAWTRTHLLDDAESAWPWIARMAYNLFINEFRRSKRDARLKTALHQAALMEEDNRLCSEALMADHFVSQPIQAALDELPPQMREPVILVDMLDYKYREVAELLGCPLGTVMSRIHRGRRRLSRRLAPLAAERGINRRLKPRPGAEQAAGDSIRGDDIAEPPAADCVSDLPFQPFASMGHSAPQPIACAA